jgi:hypothetical protein
MVWFFGRGSETVKVQTRFDNVTREYVLEIAWGDGRVETERFRELSDFEARTKAVEQRLKSDSWVRSAAPTSSPRAGEVPSPTNG